MARKINFSISGVGNDPYHDGQLKCHYIYASSNAAHESIGEASYNVCMSAYRNELPVVLNYVEEPGLNITANTGVIALTNNEDYFSIYRREYQIYERMIRDPVSGTFKPERQTVQGPWKPVNVKTNRSLIRDFNIVAGHSYQYILYPTAQEVEQQQQFANPVGDDPESPYRNSSVPIETSWDEWSLIELKPVQNSVDAPVLRKTFEVDLDNIWLFKYSLETGSQTQNFQKSEIQTLGQYQRMGYGKLNFVSGDVTCLLGSEIVPYSRYGYIERMRKSIRTPLSTNEKAYMLKQWRKIAFSPNPKLLKDIKGQSWIVQIVSNNNTPKNFYANEPDTISFSWRQIDDTDNVIIIGDGGKLPDTGEYGSTWKKVL